MNLVYVLCAEYELADAEVNGLMRRLRAHPECFPQPAMLFEVSIRVGHESAITATANRFERACCGQSYVRTTGTVTPGQLRHIIWRSWSLAGLGRRPRRAELAPLIGALRSSLRRSNGGVIIVAPPATVGRSLRHSPVATPPAAFAHGTLLALVVQTNGAPPTAGDHPMPLPSDLEIIHEFCLRGDPNAAPPAAVVPSLAV